MAEEKMGIRAVGGRFLAGKWQEQAENIAVFESHSLEKGTLYLLVEVAGEGGEGAIARSLVKIMGESFLRARGGITNSLRQAFRAANSQILEYNRQRRGDMPVLGGVSCGVVRGRDLFLGMGGAALALHRHGEETRIYPPSSTRDAAPIPLGVEESLIDVQIIHLPLGRGDIFVLASPTLRQLLSQKEMAEALAGGRAGDVLADLKSLAGGQELSFLVLEMGAGAAPQQIIAQRARQISFAFLGRLKDKAFWAGLGQRVGNAIKSFWEWAKFTAREMLPGEEKAPAVRRARPKEIAAPRPVDVRRWAVPAGVTILLLIGLLFVWNFWNQRQAQEAQFRKQVAQVQEMIDLAQQATDKESAHQVLVQAQGLLAELIQDRPNDRQVLAVQEGFRTEWDEVNGIERPPLRVAFELGIAEDGLRRLVFHDNSLFILDRGSDQLYVYNWTPEARALESPSAGAILIAPGEEGELLDIVWVERGGFRTNPGLLVLTETELLEYDPQGGLSPAIIVEREKWPTPASLGGFSGNFYVLDGGANAIWRYFATEAGYTLSPDSWVSEDEPLDLSAAIDMAIDGSIWVLAGEGEIIKLEQGIRRVFELKGLLDPLTQPVELYTDSETDNLYVADGGLGRIVVFNKQGQFLRQYLAPWGSEDTFASMEAMAVAEDEGVAFILAGGKLYIVDLRIAAEASPTPTP